MDNSWVDQSITAATDKRILVIVSVIVCTLLLLLGGLIFYHSNHPLLRFISCIAWLFSLLPFCCWRRCFRRKIILFPDHIILCDGEKKRCYENSELKAITVGMHTVVYFPGVRRFVVMFTPLTRETILQCRNPRIWWGYNGDLRMRIPGRILAGSYIFLFLLHYAVGTRVSDFLIGYLFITVSLCFLFWLVNYLFFD